MKQRFSSLDVTASLPALREKLVGLRLQNVYDINTKTYLFKFAKADAKEMLVIESGIRLHTTSFQRDKNATPSPFAMKLRKHIRTRRLTHIHQVGVDRIIDFQFGEDDAENVFHIIIELYASGNIILTDKHYKIMALLRVVSLDASTQDKEETKFAVGEVYPATLARPHTQMTVDTLVSQLSSIEKPMTLKKLMRPLFGGVYGPALCEHVLMVSQLNPLAKCPGDVDISPDSTDIQALFQAFQQADNIIMESRDKKCPGYIIAKDLTFTPPSATDTASTDPLTSAYIDFHPYLFQQFQPPHLSKDVHVLPFDTFDQAVDEYFSKLEAQRLELKNRQAELAAQKKLASVRLGHESQLRGFEVMKEHSVRAAEAIEANLPQVEALIQTLRGFIASGMDWIDLAELIKEEAKNNNPLAQMVAQLKLDVGMVAVHLPDSDQVLDELDQSGDNEEDDAAPQESNKVKVDIDIYSSAYANARRYFDVKKTATSKQEKTLQVASKALKTAEKKILSSLKQAQQATASATIVKARKPFWFEKFLWFISSENYLIVGGRDAGQNEMLVKRYLNKGDIYVHADLHGAASVIIKNPYYHTANREGLDPNMCPPVVADGTCPIPPLTLHQAGTMSVCMSKAWDSKIVTSAWWVYDDQVSKTAPSGEYLTTGSFMIRGKKNWLPPVQLVYGFGILFKMDESCVGRHLWDRRPWARGQDIPVESGSNSSLEEMDVSPTVQEQIQPEQVDTRQDEADEGEEFEFPDTQVNVLSSIETPAEDKYNLEELNEALSEEGEEEKEESGEKTGRKYLTAKQRREQKKSRKGVALSDSTPSPQMKEKTTTESPSSPPIPKQVRGKKGKQKKIKEKYADQDDEDRQNIIEFLGSNKGPQPKGKKAKEAARKKAEQEAAAEARREQQAKAAQSLAETSEEALENKELENEGNDDPAPSRDSVKDDEQEIRQMLEEENVALVEEDQTPLLSYLDTLTGQPHPEDVALHAVAVCAPWSALTKFKYKVKLLPGSLKKGKAAKSAISSFLAMKSDRVVALEKSKPTEEKDPFAEQCLSSETREKELIRLIPEHEMILQIMGKVKVMVPEADRVKKGGKRK